MSLCDSVSLNSRDFESGISRKISGVQKICFDNCLVLCYLPGCQESTTNSISFDPNRAFVVHRFTQATILLGLTLVSFLGVPSVVILKIPYIFVPVMSHERWGFSNHRLFVVCSTSCQYIEAKMKWLICWRWYIEMHFLYRKWLYFYSNFI